ncbi:MAG: cellulase family glycosylhydrolase [Nocardioidaceae bacterium]|nr:cellulase family glycosylhydrolase [Nocardioidaceae bacterium]NUS51190.1 cellulase family glycosylhydrolase [Nocardioidaceae bacterium]
MWRSYDPGVVREELGVLREHGLDMTRSFFYWPDFMPEPDRVDESLAEHYADFLDAHVEQGMTTVPTFVVGHMSGENWDPAWRDGRDLYGDVWLVARQAWFVRTMTERFAGHPAVSGWLISNEMPLYGGPADTDTVTAWAELVVQAVRAGGGHQPVSLGDGAWGIEVTGRDNGFSVRDTARLVDFVGPHVYPMQDDVVRQHLRAAFVCELAAVARRPVVLEEFGLSSDFVSPEHAGHYYRQVLHTSLLAGATGWVAWNNTDYDDLLQQDPYRHHAFEMHFGITDSRGRPKPPLLELRDFADVLARVDVGHCARTTTRTALLVSSYLEGAFPMRDPGEGPFVFGCLEQAHVAAREADLAPGFVRERDGVDGGYALYLVPSTKQLTAPTWFRLQELAESGATVWVSYAAGDSDFQRGPWWVNTEALFGVRNALTYGLNDPIEDDEVTLRFVAPLGELAEGTELTFRAGGNEHARAFLPVEVLDAEVLAVDGRGRPALLRRRHGDGQAVLSTYPLEHLAAATPRVNPEPTWRLYRALAVEAGATPSVTVDDPRVLVDGLDHADGSRFVWLVSETPEQTKVTPRTPAGIQLRTLDDAPAADVLLPPYGVRVLRLTDQPHPEENR